MLFFFAYNLSSTYSSANTRDKVDKMQISRIESILPKRLKTILSSVESFNYLQEIRLRTDRPIYIYYQNEEYCINRELRLVKKAQDYLIATKEDVQETLEYVSRHSLYAFEEEIRSGYITIEGGHRIGISGKVVMEGGKVKTIRNVSCLNIRISHEVKGCGNRILPHLIQDSRLCHTLIISPPKCGKTTLLRDLIRQISDGSTYLRGQSVGVVDERSEIAGCYRGIPQNDVGSRTDILDGCLKVEGMMMLIRAMSPSVLALDEIGTMEDLEAVEYAMHSGCKMLCTVHGESLNEIICKPGFKSLFERGVFNRYVVLENKKSIGDYVRIYDSKGQSIVEVG